LKSGFIPLVFATKLFILLQTSERFSEKEIITLHFHRSTPQGNSSVDSIKHIIFGQAKRQSRARVEKIIAEYLVIYVQFVEICVEK